MWQYKSVTDRYLGTTRGEGTRGDNGKLDILRKHACWQNVKELGGKFTANVTENVPACFGPSKNPLNKYF